MYSMKNRLYTHFRIITIAIGMVLFSGLKAQDSRVLVTTNPNNGNEIWVKWFHESIISDMGYNVYRKRTNSNNWEKINAQPIKRGTYSLSEEAFAKDEELADMKDLVDELSENSLQGFSKALVLLKMTQSFDFARYIGVMFTDNNVTPGKRYEYKITKVSISGERNVGISEPISTGSHTTVTPPDSISVKVTGTRVHVKWQPEPLRYFAVNVYRYSDYDSGEVVLNKAPIVIAKRKGPNGKMSYPPEFYVDEDLPVDTDFEYRLTAIDFFGVEGDFSIPFKVTTRDTIPPLPSHSLKAKADNYTVSLNWLNVFQDDVRGIQVMRSYKNESNYKPLHVGYLSLNTIKFTDVAKDPGFYYYKIAVYDNSGNVNYSSTAPIRILDVIPPAVPQQVRAVADTGKITLSWRSNTEADFMGYRIYRTVDKNRDKQFVLINPEVVTDTFYVDSLPKRAKNTFVYRLAALDSSYNKSEYTPVIYTRMPDVVAPVKPFIKSVRVVDDKLRVEWIANVEPDLKGYDVYRKQLNDTTNASLKKINTSEIAPYVNRFTDRWVEANTEYAYQIVAFDSSYNNSPPSEWYSAILVKSDTTKTSQINRFQGAVKNKHIQLSWDVNKAKGYKGAVVYKSDISGIFKPLTTLTQERNFTDMYVKEGETYTYRLKIYDEHTTQIETINVIMPSNEDE
jgi:hypothetical protein